ncbi:MAG: hypothetical protein JWM95_60 [Gemmatimonadetes bacterium]|nr:hypothetical protein [Gemmatimonadota bacterium]
MNLYGFASGDPVNFSDPLGLCGEKDEEPCPSMMDQVNKGMADAFASLANKTLEVTAGLVNAVTGLGDLLTAAGLNPSVQGAGGRALAGASALFGVVANGPKVEAKAMGHIFRDAVGHVNPGTATSEARYMGLFEAVAGNAANRNDAVVAAAGQAAGVQGFTQRFRQGEVWVHVIGGKITNAGINP